MRRLGNALLVVAVVAVVAVALLDAVDRGEPRAEERPPPAPAPLPERAAGTLADAGVSGRLVFSDPDCHRHVLQLPSLARTEIPRVEGCGVFAHRGSLGVNRGEVGWFAFPGGTTMLLTRDQLAHELGRRPGALGTSEPLRRSSFAIRLAAWLGNTRYAALIVGPGIQGHRVALFERSRLVRSVAEIGPAYSDLRSSPQNGYFAAVSASGALALWSREGDPVGLARPLAASARAIAWSPDEKWTAVATRGAVFLFPTETPRVPMVSLPIAARDLAWLP
jgi:hypothetical protein